jgi:hypothetical protein
MTESRVLCRQKLPFTPGLGPGIHEGFATWPNVLVDGRAKPGPER